MQGKSSRYRVNGARYRVTGNKYRVNSNRYHRSAFFQHACAMRVAWRVSQGTHGVVATESPVEDNVDKKISGLGLWSVALV